MSTGQATRASAPPRLLKGVPASYTLGAMRNKLRGSIWLTCIMSSDGTTRDVQLVSGLEEQMEAKVVAALTQSTFEPGQHEGKPVAVRVTVQMTYTVR